MRGVPIAGYPGYTIDRTGIVWSYWTIGRSPMVDFTRRPRRLRVTVRRRDGYVTARIYFAARRMRTLQVHRLVLEAFVGPCPPGQEASHLNNRPGDNRVDNLAWRTHVENEGDKRRFGTLVVGAKNGRAKLTPGEVQRIRKLSTTGRWTQREIAARYSVTGSAVWDIVHRRNWTHLP